MPSVESASCQWLDLFAFNSLELLQVYCRHSTGHQSCLLDRYATDWNLEYLTRRRRSNTFFGSWQSIVRHQSSSGDTEAFTLHGGKFCSPILTEEVAKFLRLLLGDLGSHQLSIHPRNLEWHCEPKVAIHAHTAVDEFSDIAAFTHARLTSMGRRSP